jgi:hypothetical protein
VPVGWQRPRSDAWPVRRLGPTRGLPVSPSSGLPLCRTSGREIGSIDQPRRAGRRHQGRLTSRATSGRPDPLPMRMIRAELLKLLLDRVDDIGQVGDQIEGCPPRHEH